MPNLRNPALAAAERHFAEACRASRMHDELAREALDTYGDHGPAISGCVRDHFPDHVKDSLRRLARRVAEECEAARRARPPRVRSTTIRALATMVATRDGSGFYGPQPV